MLDNSATRALNVLRQLAPKWRLDALRLLALLELQQSEPLFGVQEKVKMIEESVGIFSQSGVDLLVTVGPQTLGESVKLKERLSITTRFGI